MDGASESNDISPTLGSDAPSGQYATCNWRIYTSYYYYPFPQRRTVTTSCRCWMLGKALEADFDKVL